MYFKNLYDILQTEGKTNQQRHKDNILSNNNVGLNHTEVHRKYVKYEWRDMKESHMGKVLTTKNMNNGRTLRI